MVIHKRLAKSVADMRKECIKTKEGSSTPLLRPCHCAEEQTLADRSAARARAATSDVHADHAGLIGVIHVLSGGGRRNWRSRDAVRLIALPGVKLNT